ncbi:piggyBac transposable element-derived protein 4-like [Macrobrachium rosenbergii]|uniref:piggyBac transposable element-derived protein 4-like n=1 Tax=Macrobrachium rosenbergii TaxID=79674 RepID=UPI0034D79885
MRMGIINLPEMEMFWARDKPYSMPAFAMTMSRRKFEALGKYFHCFNCRALHKDNTDKLVLIRPVMEYIQAKCKTLYVPQKNLSLDEGMLKWKGRLSIKVYNPKKPIRYGMKFFFLCESKSGYVLDFSIYRGISSSLRDTVFQLMGQHLDKGYHIYMDNYYNSVEIAEELYSRGTHCSGTLRITWRGAPKVLRNCVRHKRLLRGDMDWRKKDNTFVICWQDIRCVTFVTTASNAATEPFIHKRRVKKQGRYELEEQRLQRPKAVGDYIAYMGGVDHFDQMINYYTFARRSRRWTKKTTLYLLQVVLFNSYVLYQKYRPDRRSKCLTFRQYHEEIATALLHFELAMWPDSGGRIAHAPDIPVEQRFDKPPPRPSPPAGGDGVVAGPAAAALPTDAARPAAHARLGSKPDHPHRLLPTGTIVGGGVRVVHKHEKLGGVRQQRMCRVCSKNGYRRDTVYQCSYCKVALCQVTGECFMKYHNLQQYWTPCRSGDGRRARVPGRN